MGWGENASTRVKVPLRKDLENISGDGSAPLTHRWLKLCPGWEHWQNVGQWGMLSFPQIGK